jgi:hypothetical protein
MPSPHQAVFDALSRFRISWPRRGWSYDNRVQCVASTFDAEFAREARTLVQTLLPHVWTDRTLPSAGDLFVEIARRTGGVRSTQLIFGADPVGRLILYGLWWPWENGNTISLRIGLEGASQGDLMELCSAFGTEP